MRNITILYDGSSYTYSWIKAMMWAKRDFYNKGFIVKYDSFIDYFPILQRLNPKQKVKYEEWRLNKALKKSYDIVFLAFHHSTTTIGKNKEKRINFLSKLRKRSKVVCWLDTADSTGSCLFDVLPYVDLYFKKQLLKDRRLYLKELYFDRLYCQYYHDHFGIVDEKQSNITNYSLKEDDLRKLRIAWNMGLSDNYFDRKIMFLRPNRLLFKMYNNANKSIDIHYGGSNPSVYGKVVGFQRSHILELVNSLDHVTHPDVYKKVPRKMYLNELKNSKTIISPFGWGEVCFRDFEAFIYGATLIKPEMDHCETYPDFFVKDETYVPLKWDFSNFEEITNSILTGNYENIAETGQKHFEEYVLGKTASEKFAKHIITQLSNVI